MHDGNFLFITAMFGSYIYNTAATCWSRCIIIKDYYPYLLRPFSPCWKRESIRCGLWIRRTCFCRHFRKWHHPPSHATIGRRNTSCHWTPVQWTHRTSVHHAISKYLTAKYWIRTVSYIVPDTNMFAHAVTPKLFAIWKFCLKMGVMCPILRFTF